MPTLIMAKWPRKLDGSERSKAMAFLQKLSHDDTTPGLHVEPINGSADPRVRTGRVDQFWRAVMFRLEGAGEPHYVVHGVWPHDEAISVARAARLTMNPINGLPQIEDSGRPAPTPAPPPAPETRRAPAPEPAAAEPLLPSQGRTLAELTDRLGVPGPVADEALAASDQEALTELAARHEGWLGLVLLDLAVGDAVDTIIDRLGLEAPRERSDDADADLLASLRRPAARTQFSFIEDQEELRQVIEQRDFEEWRVFLHPDQRRYAEKSYSGAFRLSGGAGTGKTVVLMHRARELARRRPQARLVLTTFTTNLARALGDGLTRLDPRLPRAGTLGDAGVYVSGVDALASAVLRRAGGDLSAAVRVVLGEERAQPTGRTPSSTWRDVLDGASTSLPSEIANDTFLRTEYALVVLPKRVITEADYLRVRRPGRGMALDRAKRAEVWSLIAAYRAQARVEGTLDFLEAAAVAAAHLDGSAGDPQPLVDHILVDEGQDLSPTHWQLLRALASEGPDDLFIAEDSHQRIYGPRTVLGHYDIKIVGRSHRLTLNYRTTAQNLAYSLTLLEGGDYVDAGGDTLEAAGYRSARSGPQPREVTTRSPTDEMDAVAEQLREWAAAGDHGPGATAVLAPDRYHCERLVTGLSERGVSACLVDRDSPPADQVAVMTMHRAKGTEFAKVVLTGVGSSSRAEQARLAELDESERTDVELQKRSLTYVAATRARDELTVVRRT